MKQFFAFILALALLFSCSVSLAAGYDLSYAKSKSGVFTVDEDTDRDVAFIESTLSVSDRSFVHKYESDYRYSSTMFDILVVDCSRSTSYPVPRLWITYCADNYLYYDSVTFTIDGTDYTFSGISDSDWRTKDENGVVEEVLIKFGTEALPFLGAMETLYEKYPSYDELMDERIEEISRLSAVPVEQFVKINPAEFAEKNKHQLLRGYEYKSIRDFIVEKKKDDQTFLVSPVDAIEETAAQVSYKSGTEIRRTLRASKCAVLPCPTELAQDFFIRNHRQSPPIVRDTAVCYGLVFKDELVAVMLYDMQNGAVRGKKTDYELVRLAISKGTVWGNAI